MKLNSSLCIAAVLSAMASVSATAQIVSGYSYNAAPEGQAQGGTYNYFDDTGHQLLDGVTGLDNWHADQGSGAAYEWVGWRVADAQITFNFDGLANAGFQTKVVGIELGFSKYVGDGIYIPASFGVTSGMDSQTFAIDQTGLWDQRTFITADLSGLNILSNFTVDVSDGDASKWVFLDEVRFIYATTKLPDGSAVPEPSTYGLIGAAGLLGVAAYRRRSSAKK